MKGGIVTLMAMIASWALAAGVPMTPAHEQYLERGIMAIVHWGPNTYTDQEWGFGNVKPEVVQPSDFNPSQWAKAMKAAEIKSVVFVAKHHDGFCLWPSAHNPEYSTLAMSGKYKGTDFVKLVEKACRREGLKFGVYLSPWYRHQGSYGNPEYVKYFHNQWNEMFSGKYGDICEIWLDGANGGNGWYGGVKGDKGERRRIPAGYYQTKELVRNFVRQNPMGVAFGGQCGNSVAWCGTERGSLPDRWSYERKGDDGRPYFMPPEVDTPLRDGWFYHERQHPKSLSRMVDCYFESVGRGGVLNWGIAPDKAGRLCEEDVKRLGEFGAYVRKFNAVDLAKGSSVQKSATEGRTASVTFHLSGVVPFNAVDFGEDLSEGQLARRWTVEAWIGAEWKEVAKGSTVGYRRIARFDVVKSGKVRITIQGSKGPKIVRPAVRYAVPIED